jgi:hypothetical protein
VLHRITGALSRLARNLDEPAERVHEPHLVDRVAADVDQARAADQVREALRARDRDVQAVAREQGLEAARDLGAARARRRVENDRRPLALELVDRADAHALRKPDAEAT